ncbi:MAG: tRNA lysidine(34) synthetase TilS [Acholeplasmataceae bacterium]
MKNALKTLKEHLQLNKKTTLIISVSGGSDSMALAHLLASTAAKVVIVHFNHMQREQSRQEAEMVENFAKSHGFSYHYYTLELDKQNFQHQAHHMRRHYLKEVARIYQTPYILTAHHLDDLLESILIKLTKGSNLLGYAGMQYIHEKEGYAFVKPLLYVDKKSILSYLKEHNVAYMEDASNHEDHYLRNRYRHTITPIMKQENPNLLEQAQAFHYQLTHAFNYIRKQTLAYLKGAYELNLETFKTLDQAIKDDVIVYLIEAQHLKINHRTLLKILEMLASDKPNQSYQLSADLHFIKAYDKAYIKPLLSDSDVKIQLSEGLTRYKNMSIFTFLQDSAVVTEEFSKLCYNKLAFPLWLRHKKEGDLLAFDYGHKKLKKLMIDLKIPTEQRKTLWVLTDNDDHILLVDGIYINQTLGSKNTLYFHITEDPNA